MQGEDGHVIREGSHVKGRTVLSYFYSSFPMKYLAQMVDMTNENLSHRKEAGITCGEVMTFFGVLILMMMFEFGVRKNFWKTTTLNRYIKPAGFGEAMSRNRFDSIFECIVFSNAEVSGGVYIYCKRDGVW